MLKDWLERVFSPSLIAVVHIPKTGGSSLNSILTQWSAQGRPHCEGFLGNTEELGRLVRDIPWLSGHVPLPVLRTALLSTTRRRLHFYTVLREPTSQIASHYNWLIEIQHRGEAFFEGHPREIKAMSRVIRESDNRDTGAITRNLEQFGHLFLNQQFRMAIGGQTEIDVGSQVAQVAREYRMIGTEYSFDELAFRITGERGAQPVRENTSRYHFDPHVFRSPPVQAFLRERHAADYQLYEWVRYREKEARKSGS